MRKSWMYPVLREPLPDLGPGRLLLYVVNELENLVADSWHEHCLGHPKHALMRMMLGPCPAVTLPFASPTKFNFVGLGFDCTKPGMKEVSLLAVYR